MTSRLRHAKHLILLVLVLFVALAAFLLLRRAVVPEGFGLYGHYRAPAVDEIMLRPAAFAGQNVCADCHPDIVETRNGGKHGGISCESCHGPLGRHVEDPTIKPRLPDSRTLCARCHEADVAKPRQFPQVKSREHSGNAACTSCHRPHRPRPVKGERTQP